MNLIPICPNIENCFELFGFDIMIDQGLKPWLLEVNSSPALAMDGAADQKVKPEMLKDTFKLLNFESYDVYHDRLNQQNKRNREN